LIAATFATIIALPLILFVLFPLSSILKRSFVTPDGFGLGNYAH
jgi:iron(III) transport system permease protein